MGNEADVRQPLPGTCDPRGLLVIAAALAIAPAAMAADKPNDAQIAHIAYTAGNIDVAAGKQALDK